jgi:hypothetical protein
MIRSTESPTIPAAAWKSQRNPNDNPKNTYRNTPIFASIALLATRRGSGRENALKLDRISGASRKILDGGTNAFEAGEEVGSRRFRRKDAHDDRTRRGRMSSERGTKSRKMKGGRHQRLAHEQAARLRGRGRECSGCCRKSFDGSQPRKERREGKFSGD